MSFRRRSASFQSLCQALCVCLFLQGSGIAQALPLPPKKTYLTKHELETARLHRGAQAADRPAEPGFLQRVAAAAWIEAETAGRQIDAWLEDARAASWAEAVEPPLRIARSGGPLPLPARLFPAFLALPPPQSGPPTPPGFASGKVEATPSARAAELIEKAGTDEIPLVAGWNLISLPLDPPDSDPAAVFAPIAGQLARVEAHDVCDAADPWKLYDPADAAASDLTAVTPAMGLWVKVTAATVLPLAGTLPATTDVALCQGWNHIGFPADQPRAPTAVFSSIAGKWQRLFGHDAFDIKDPFEFFDPAVPAWANDLELMRPGYGYWLLASEATTLTISNQGPPPTVAFTAPLDLGVVTEPTEITGTVDSDRLESWTLSAQPKDDGPPVVLATGTAPVADAPLGTFDPTLLLNGLYQLELTATDFQGQQVTEQISITVEGQMKIGHFSLSFVDLRVPVSGLDIEIVRTYQSRDKQQRDFGVGWSLDIRQGSYRNSRMPGDGWQIVASQPPSPFPCVGAVETKSHTTVIRLSDQEVYRFRPTVIDPLPGVGRCDGRVIFEYVDGPLPGTTLDIIGNDLVYYENAAGNDQLIDYDTLATFEPQNVRLTTRDGRIFELDLEEGVTLVEDLNGNQLTITPAGITHSSGKSIAFTRDTEGRILKITDPLNREMFYAYDAAGDLASFTDRAGAISRFTYDDHRLLDIEDPRGVKPIRNEYDDDGRLVRHIDAFGKVIELDHDLENRREIVTNRLGASRALEYDARGNVVHETDELGKATTRVFDGRDNLLSETDPLGRKTEYTYSASNDLLSQKDPLGNETTYTYNGRGQVLTVTDPRGHRTTHVYDSHGNLTSTTDALAKVTSLTYTASGDLETTTDALGHMASFGYDSSGNLISETDALGHEAVSTYDAAGNRLTQTRTRTLADGSTETLVTRWRYDDLDRVTRTTFADGSSTSTTYDLLGKVTSQTDLLGRTIRMTYDSMGRLATTSYPDTTSTSQSYDAEGRLIAQVDRAGRTTSFAYDAAGRLIRTTHSDGSSTSSLFDDAGQLVGSTDARGNTTSFSYDAAGRRTGVIDALGQGMSFGYDESGNQIRVIDAKGHATSFAFEALNRLTITTYPDGSTSEVGSDALGRRISETDQAGITTEFSYDALGRLIRVTDALQQVTSYSYDEVGNRLTQTDANSHTTRFEYDALGRQTARILPDGARESMTYNADGTLASHTDFNGARRTFEYDANQRLARRAYPDGSDVTFAYTPTGRRKTVVDARGVTSYSYDARDRLTEKTDPTGYKLSYTYDSQGNRTSLTATVGAEVYTTGYTYDALNRPETVTDSQGGVTRLGYDANGNQASLAHPNGVTTTYLYDPQNRLTELETKTSIGVVLQSYHYTLGLAGHRLRIDEHDGTSRHYTYDDLYRLTQDRVTDPADTLIYQRGFTYDPVGNRLEETIEEGAGPTAIASTYDVRDRQLTATSTGSGWDANGNLKARDGTSYGWDLENRLSSVTHAGGTLIETTYDADGNRVRAAITGPSGAVTTIDYVVDTAGFLSHVIVEVTEGTVQALYTRADNQLIGLNRPTSATSRYHHADGLGSVRVLSDQTGGDSDRYAYTAFGQLIEHDGASLQPYLFAGQPFDPNVRFYYNRARWLDPEIGRFVSVDPVGGVLSDPASLHKYLYAANDPANATDPTGRFTSVGEALLVIAIQLQLVAPYIQTAALILAVAAGTFYIFTGLAIAVDDWISGGAYTESLYVLRDSAANVFFISYFAAGGASTVALTRPGHGTPVRTVTVSRSRYPQSSAHIEDAVAAGKPRVFTVDRSNAAARRAASLRGVPRVAGRDRDEYPPAVFLEGGRGASVRPISPSDNRGSGSSIGHQLRGVADGEIVRLEVVD